MLRALYAVWNDTPPAHLQLARIASMLGAAVGVKPPRPRKPISEHEKPSTTDAEEAWLAALPERPAPRVLSKAEYWAMRESERE